MKNYIITSNEYEIIKRRLNRLYEKRQKLKDNIHNITSKIKEVVTSGGNNQEKMLIYVAELEEVEKEIKEREEEATQLDDDLSYMLNRLSNIEDIKEQVFVMFYIRGMKPKHIALQIPCDISTVYKKIREINKERQEAKKSQKYSGIM